MSRTSSAIRYGVVALFCAAGTANPQGAPADAPLSRYYVVFLRPRPDRKELPKSEADRLQSSHMANIRKMAKDGVLIAAGPFDDSPRTISGLFVFKTDSLRSAQDIAALDPTVLEQRNTVDAHAWLGPAGIGEEYARLHKQNPQTPENMQVHPLAILYRGTSSEQKSGDRDSGMASHRRYLDDLRMQGKLAAAGPVDAPDEIAGIVIFKVIPLEEARRLLSEDPAIRSGLLRVEYHQWWSSDHVLPW